MVQASEGNCCFNASLCFVIEWKCTEDPEHTNYHTLSATTTLYGSRIALFIVKNTMVADGFNGDFVALKLLKPKSHDKHRILSPLAE